MLQNISQHEEKKKKEKEERRLLYDVLAMKASIQSLPAKEPAVKVSAHTGLEELAVCYVLT